MTCNTEYNSILCKDSIGIIMKYKAYMEIGEYLKAEECDIVQFEQDEDIDPSYTDDAIWREVHYRLFAYIEETLEGFFDSRTCRWALTGREDWDKEIVVKCFVAFVGSFVAGIMDNAYANCEAPSFSEYLFEHQCCLECARAEESDWRVQVSRHAMCIGFSYEKIRKIVEDMKVRTMV